MARSRPLRPKFQNLPYLALPYMTLPYLVLRCLALRCRAIRYLALCCVALWFCPRWVNGQTAPATVLERLDRLEQENRNLSEEVRALRAELAGVKAAGPVKPGDALQVPETSVPTGAATSAATSAANQEQQLEIQQRRVDEQSQTKVEASQKFPIRLTGMALFNAFMDSKQNGGVDYPVVAAPTGPGRAGATIRQTIIGLDFEGPGTVWGGKVQGSVYMDLFAPAPLNSAMRVRTASIELDWKDRSIMMGLEKPIFNPREPSSLAQVGISPLTGAGNLWLWLPQVRAEQTFHFLASTGVRAQIGVVETRELGSYVGAVAAEANRPGLEGRFNFFHNLDDERRLEFAPGFHVSTTHAGGKAIQSSLYSFDWFFNPWRPVEFTGAFYSGQNVAHLGSGTRQGFGSDSPGDIYAVDSRGGWGQVTLHALRRLDFHLFTGQVNDSSRMLGTGAIGKNLLFGGNSYFHLAPNVILALEATQVRTVYLGQGTLINNHYDLALAYLF
jgi:hypothetical protein